MVDAPSVAIDCLGDNKTIRGFIVMVPATSLAFALLAALLMTPFPTGLNGLWPLTSGQYALLGRLGRIGFHGWASFPTRSSNDGLGIPPGAAAHGRVFAPLFSVVDRIDSIVGLMLALIVVVPVPWGTWLCVVLVGPALHGLFSVALFRLGVKARPA